MDMNKIDKVAESLGLKLNEVFLSEGYRFKFTENGLFFYNVLKKEWEISNESLTNLITGKVGVEKIPYTPGYGETYYFVNVGVTGVDCYVDITIWKDCMFDFMNYSFGNVFFTEKECEDSLDVIWKRFENTYIEFFRLRSMKDS